MKFTAIISKGGGDRILELDKETANEAIDFARFLANQQGGFLSFVFTDRHEIIFKQELPSYTAVIELNETREKLVELNEMNDEAAIKAAETLAAQYGGSLKRVLDGKDPVYMRDSFSAVILKDGFTYTHPTYTDNLNKAIEKGNEIAKQNNGSLYWILDNLGYTIWSNDEAKGLNILYAAKINGEIRTLIPFDVIHDEGKKLFLTDDYKILELDNVADCLRFYQAEYSPKGFKLQMLADSAHGFKCVLSQIAIKDTQKIFPMYLAGGWMESMMMAQAAWDNAKAVNKVVPPDVIRQASRRFEYCAKELDNQRPLCQVVRDSVAIFLNKQQHKKPQPPKSFQNSQNQKG